ncbi:MAG: hypothetical protein HYV00_13770, partial [Deltaproteobacteria bacterium]|nr:hypothetical protein [Deltaproteobacteria bacterium]
MYEKEKTCLKNKMATAITVLRWELCDMWGHVSAKTPDGKHFLLQHLRPPMEPSIRPDRDAPTAWQASS